MKDNNFADKGSAVIELDTIDTNSAWSSKDASKASLFHFTRKLDLLYIILGSIFSAIASLGSPVQTIIYGRIFTKLTDFYLYNFADYKDFIKDVGIYCVMIIVVGAIKLILTILMVMCWMKNGENHQKRVRNIVFEKILYHSNVEWVENFKNINGEINQLNRCIEELRTGNAECLGLLIEGLVGCLALFIVAMVFSWSVTLVTLALTPFLGVATYFFGKLANKYANKENFYSARSSKIINWCLLHPAVTRLFNGKDSDVLNFKNLVNSCSKFNNRVENITNFNVGIIKAVTLLMFVQGFWFGNTMIRLRKVDINEVFTSFSCCLMLAGEVSLLSELLGEIFRAQAAIGKLKSFINLNDNRKPESKMGNISPPWCNGSIELRDVLFKYSQKQEIVLKHMNLKFKSNELNFVIGKSGSGKSTLVQLIMGFYKANEGTVLLDDVDINELDKNWILNNISMIQLNPIIFNQSIKENIAMSALNKYNSTNEVPNDIIREVCDFALLNKLVSKVGLDKPISNSTLSGGEKQRIAIARAKLRDTPILIIDEGLSALDQKNRDTIFKSLKIWRAGKTTIYITHQLDQISDNDNVFIISDGTVLNQGLKKDLPNERIIKDARLSVQTARSVYTGYSYESDSDDEKDLSDTNTTTKPKIKDYNYLKDPLALKAVEGASLTADEHIYPLTKILMYYLKTVNSKTLVFFGLIFAAIYAVSNPLFSYLFSRLLDNMLDTSIGIDRSADLKRWACIVLGIAIANGLTYYLSHFILAVSAETWVNKLRKLSLAKINDQELRFFEDPKNNPSTINSLLMNDTRDLRTMVYKFITISITILILVSLGIIFALVLGWRLALTGVAFVVLILFVSIMYAKLVQKHETLYKDRINDVETVNYEMVNGIKTIHSLNLNLYFAQNFVDRMQELEIQGRRRALHTGISLALNILITSVATGILMYYGMKLVGRRTYDRLQFLQVITLLLMTFTTAGTLLNELPDITRGQRCGSYIMRLLQLPSSKTETSGDLKPEVPVKDEIVKFSNVNFAYSANRPALQNINFKVKEGDIFGIIGESGSGKSTILSLLTRLHGDYIGSIQLNKTEITNVEIKFLREYISIVPQNPTFFEGSIYDNLTYGLLKERLVNSNIDEYLKLCNIESFTNSLSEGLQTSIGSLTENSLISTGQLQRLAMVRALIRKPKVLILDECTSNLDTQNFNLFKQLILDLNKTLGTTIIIISHSTELQEITTNTILLSHGQIA